MPRSSRRIVTGASMPAISTVPFTFGIGDRTIQASPDNATTKNTASVIHTTFQAVAFLFARLRRPSIVYPLGRYPESSKYSQDNRYRAQQLQPRYIFLSLRIGIVPSPHC